MVILSTVLILIAEKLALIEERSPQVVEEYQAKLTGTSD